MNLKKEIDIFSLDLTSIPENDRKDIINIHSHCVELSKNAAAAKSSSSSNVRSLFLMMFTTIVLSLQDLDNKTIIMVIVMAQFVKSIFSKMFESVLYSALDLAKKDYKSLLTKKIRNNEDV